MLKQLILTIAFFICLVGFSQKNKPIVTEHQKKVQQTLVYNPNPYSELGKIEQTQNNTVSNNTKLEGFENIGWTSFDQQSYSSLDNRFCSFSNGTMAAVYNFCPGGGGPEFEEMGTGYAYFDGNEWTPMATIRIESDRSGWPTIAPYGETGELVVSHLDGTSSGNVGLVFNTRPVSGTGEWTEGYFAGPNALATKFPRVITNGENNNIIHLLYSFSDVELGGMKNPGLYSRSLDGGTNWDIQSVILEGMGPDDYQSIGDIMVWAEPKDETIAFAFANAWTTDLVVMKSETNGDDWEKIVVWEHPYPFFDWETTIMTDSMWAPDGGISIDLDNYGNVHLVASLCRVFHNEPGFNYTSWPYAEGIIYWNENRPLFENENQHNALNAWDPEILEPDVELIGWGQDIDGDGIFTLYNDNLYSYANTIGASTMPAIACGSNGWIYIAWSGICETAVINETFNNRHIWRRIGGNNGEAWMEHMDITDDIVPTCWESIWPVINKTMEDEYNLIYQDDYDPGTAVNGDHGYYESRIVHYWGDLPIVPRIKEVSKRQLSVSQNFPNPSSTSTIINVELPKKHLNLKFEVTNIIGEIVYQEYRQKVNSIQHFFTINVENYTSGIYFYTITVGDESISKKMVVR